ncbi:Golgi apparatus membrane protein TVP23 [Russula earlei]|uniref:Golgi apparatus membrane protein TVP23 n=1 Tax=Russula earlei TaxID=71964 RepID=A0ACC0U1T2_9AGAM|nr:Golgi apparatus membrane protein TVP23 [Russula earlei]
MSTAIQTIEPDDEPTVTNPHPPVRSAEPSRPASGATANATLGDAEAGLAGIFRESAHPVVLFVLYLFRIAAIATYILCGFFTDNYVVSTVIVVVLLAMDFWNCRNVAGRTLVGLRFWNQVDENGESYWIFESRDPSRPANPVDSRMFWTALYVFPALWLGLFFVSLLKFNLSFIPIVVLALVFNVTNVIGFTYADRDAKKRWADNVVSSNWSMAGLGGQMLTGVVKNSVGRVFRS